MEQLDKFAHVAHWFLRLIYLAVFLHHGLDKFADLQGFAQMTELPFIIALLVALFEVLGAVFIFLGGFKNDWGWMTRLGALLIIPVMLGAIFMVHWGQWHFMPTETHPMGGKEYQVTLLFGAIYLFLKGNLVNRGKGRVKF